MDGGAWWATVHRVGKSWTRLSDFTFTFKYSTQPKNSYIGKYLRSGMSQEAVVSILTLILTQYYISTALKIVPPT